MREVKSFATGIPNLPHKGTRVRLAPFAVLTALAGATMKVGLHEGAEGIVRHCYGLWPKGTAPNPTGGHPEVSPQAVELHLERADGTVTVHYRPFTADGLNSITMLLPDETP